MLFFSRILVSRARGTFVRQNFTKHHSAAAAAAKLLQSCPTLCDPRDSSPTRLPRPWNSPGKNTGVGCHFLLQCMKVKSESEVAQSCPTQRSHGLQPTRLLHPLDFSRQEYWSGSPLPSLPIELRHIKFINSYKRKLKIFIVKAKKTT